MNNLIRGSAKKTLLLSLWPGALVYSLLILNRFIFTEIGVHSFGRVWHYFVGWQDFGFIPRAGIGTLMNAFSINGILQNTYHTAYFLQNIIFLQLSVFFLFVALRLHLSVLWTAVLFFSPSSLAHAAYCTGSTHVHQLLVLVLLLFFVKKAWTFGAIALAGVLIHEAFIVLAISAALVFFIRTDARTSQYKYMILSLFPSIFVAMYFIIFRPTLARPLFENAVSIIIPDAVNVNYYWSGYFEIYSTVGDNLSIGTQHISDPRSWIYLMLPFMYFFLLLFKITRISAGLNTILALTASSLPLILFPLGTDIYRWLGFSCFIAISCILILHHYRSNKIHSDRAVDYGILMFCIFGPFGIGIINDPFPVHRFIYEVFFN